MLACRCLVHVYHVILFSMLAHYFSLISKVQLIEMSLLLLSHEFMLHKVKCWPNDGTRWKVKELRKLLWTQLNVNPCNSCWEMLQIVGKAFKLKPQLALEVRGSSESVGFILWQSWMSVQNFGPIHQTDVET